MVLFSIAAASFLPVGCAAGNTVFAARVRFLIGFILLMTVLQQRCNCADRRRRCERQHSFTGSFQFLLSIPLTELCQAHASLVALLSGSPGSQEILDDLFCRFSNSLSPFLEFIGIAAEILAMSVRHMLRFHNRLYTVLFKTFVRSHAAALEVYLHKISGQADLHLFADQIKGNRVVVKPVTDEIVVADNLLLPQRRLIRVLW